MFEELLRTYDQLEPPGSDAWNPLNNDSELWHRVRLYVELKRALSLIPKPVSAIRILDVGCGNGRSTRALVEFGVRPANVWGMDLRASAIEHARALNPAINYLTVSSLDSWPEQAPFDLCMQCTVFSSIRDKHLRSAVAERMKTSVAPGGYVYWWDLIRANTFAGGDRLDTRALFGDLRLIRERTVCLRPTLAEAIGVGLAKRFRSLAALQDCVRFRPTHRSALFQKPATPQEP